MTRPTLRRQAPSIPTATETPEAPTGARRAARAGVGGLTPRPVLIAQAVGAALTVAALGAADGGYAPVTWGWVTLWLLWLTSIALVLRDTIRVGPLELLYVAGLLGLTAWYAVSSTWSDDVGRSLLEVQRMLVYVSAAGVLLIVRRGSAGVLVGGVLAGVVLIATYALATRLLPDRLGYEGAARYAAYRLQEPIGYWNGLGVLCAMGGVLAVTSAAEARSFAARAAAGCGFLVLCVTLYFTYSRGAWGALLLGVLATLAFARRRLRIVTTLAVLSPTTLVATWAASRSDGLTRQVATAQEAVHDGHRLGLLLLALLPVTAVAVALLGLAERRLAPSRRLRRAYGGTLLVAGLVLVMGVVVAQGGPVRIVERVHDGFVAPPPSEENLNDRLFSLSSNGRVDLWSVAVDAAGDDLLRGSGGGTYERVWLQDRPRDLKVRDAHSLYLELVGELGIVGLTLLLTVLVAPLAAVRAARRRPLAIGAFGAFVAFLAHAAVDWDWELTAITLTALLCAVGLLAAGRPDGARTVARPVRVGLVGVVLLTGAVAFVGLRGASALSDSQAAFDAGDFVRAERSARSAIRWAPWSATARQRLGEVKLATGRPAEAREELLRAAARAPDDWSIQLNLAEAASPGADRRRALDRALDLNPRSREVRLFEQTLRRRDAQAPAGGDAAP